MDNLTLFLGDNARVPSREWVSKMREDSPYFALPLLLYLKHHSNDAATLHTLSLMSPDRRDLAIVLGHSPNDFATFYPEQQPSATPDTDTAISLFLEKYSGGSNQREVDVLSQAIFNPTPPDYADILAAQQEGDTNPEQQLDNEDRLINSFIERSKEQEQEAWAQSPVFKQHVQQQQVEETRDDNIEESAAKDNSMLSESLAKMYILRGKYSKALEIIESINLNFPEKSIYFADQIRFLRKLVLIENIKNKL